MYAVVSSGGKQYRVEPGTTLTMERIGAEAGAPFTFDRVLLIGDGDRVTVGTPVVSGASVSGTVLGEELGPKLVIFKFKQKVKYRRRTGHRQHLVRVRIDAINAHGESIRAEAQQPETAEKAKKAEAAPKATKEVKARSKTATETKAPAKRATRAKASSAKAPSAKSTSAKSTPAAEATSEEKPKAARKPRATKPKAEEPAEE